jgi:transposase
MPQNFIDCDREQAYLMAPSLRDWLAEDHLAWFVIQTVERLDLSLFYRAYRDDGHGRAAYEPSMMVGLVLYAYATKERSSRGIERHCRQDIAYRVITANVVVDHATVARFLKRHEGALGDLFASVLRLCAKAGLVKSGVVAVDGTKIAADASRDQSVDYDRIAREILAEAKATDEAEDELYGDARGDELPPELSTDAGRREWLSRELERERIADSQPTGGADAPDAQESDRGSGHEFDAERIVARVQGREGWLREAKRQLDQDRWDGAGPIPRSRSERLRDAGRRLEDDLGAERRGNEAYEHYRATARDKQGRRLSRAPNPYQPPASPDGKVNLTDPDSRLMKGTRSYIQGYNAQAAVNEQQIVLAAEITVEGVDFSQLEPMVTATVAELDKAGVIDKPDVAVADAGYWNEQHMDAVTAEHGIQVLIPPDSGKRDGPRPGWTGGRYTFMRYVLATDLGERLYAKRKQTVEPMFGHTKHNRRFDRFHRRGRTAVRTEWRLMMMTHNLTKLHSHQIATATA